MFSPEFFKMFVYFNVNNRVVLCLYNYSSACGSYHDSLDGGLPLTRKLLNQGFQLAMLKSSLWKFYDYGFVNRYGVSVSQITTHMFRLS